MAGITTSIGTFLVTVAAGAFAALVLCTALVGSVLAGLVGAVGVMVVAKVVLGNRAAKRRAAFGDQLEPTIHLLASALRAGHSLPSALNTTARDSESPTSEEFGRIVNETRIGRDLVDAMHTTGDRMENEDFHWIAEAVSVQRETGGNLNEVLDRVGVTIRERTALQREVRTLSAVVLMVLPFLVAVGQMVINPENAELLYTTSGGRIALIFSLVLYAVGGLWMKAISSVKI